MLFDAQGSAGFGTTFLLVFPGLALAHLIARRRWLAGAWNRIPGWACSVLLGAGTALALQWAAKDYQPFIYFQF